MRIVLRKVSRLSWWLLLSLIILAGILVTAAQLLSPYLSEFRSDIENQLSELTGSKVEIGQIKAHWKGLGPALKLQDIRIRERTGGTGELFLQRMDVNLDMLKMFRNGTPAPGKLFVSGIRLEIERDTQGRLHFKGFTSSTAETGANSFSLDPLLAIPDLALSDTRIDWRDRTGKTPDLNLQDIQLSIRNDGKRHQLALQASLPGKKTQQLELRADIHGNPVTDTDWYGKLYLQTRQFDLQPWADFLPPLHAGEQPLQLAAGQLNSRLWLQLDSNSLQSVSGDLSLNQLELRKSAETAFHLDALQSELLWSGNPENWQLTLQNLGLLIDQYQYGSAGFSLQHSGALNHFSLSHLELGLPEPAYAFIASILPDLPAFKASGTVHNILGSFETNDNALYLQADFDKLSWLPENNSLPGIENISGSLKLSEQGGIASLQASNSLYRHTGLFRKPIPVNSLQGAVSWHKNPSGHWQIDTGYLQADTPEIDTVSRVHIEITDQDTLIDLQTNFADGDASNASLYYPASIMSPQLVDWLDTAIVSGHVTSGSFILKGNASDFAYSDSRTGHFEVLFNTENTILDYQAGWPRLEELAAQVRFHNNSLDIAVYSGKILDSDILNAEAHIAELDRTSPVEIKGTTLGPANDALRMLGESPLKEDFGVLQSSLQIDGQTKVELDFAIPIEDEDTYRLDGYVSFMQNNLNLPEWDLQTRELQGRLHFDLDGVDARNIRANLFGSPAKVSIRNDAAGNTTLDATTRLSLKQLEPFTGDLPRLFAYGETDWQIGLTIPAIKKDSSRPATLTIQSDLQGVGIQTPLPLGKKTDESTPFTLKATLKPSGLIPLEINYRDLLQSSVVIQTGNRLPARLTQGHFHFGPEKPVLTPNGIQVTGRLDELNLDDWLHWSDQLPENNSQPGLPLSLDMVCNKLTALEREFMNFSVTSKLQNKTVSGDIRSDRFEGHYEVLGYDPVQSLTLKLSRANLPFTLDGLESQRNSIMPPDVIPPSSIPDLSITVDDLQLNDYPFGRLVFNSSHGEHSMRIDEFRINGEYLRSDLTGIWLGDRGIQKSQVDFSMESRNLGVLLERLGYTPQVGEGNTQFDGQLAWPGGLQDFSQENLSGRLNMDIRKGRLLEVNPGVGRVLGILNLAAIQRRLSLDFSDLFKEGFTFDEITASFNLDNGDAYTNNLLILSPSGKINVSGRTGLKTQDFDQLVTITPSLQSTLTIAGAIAGGPAGAAVAYLAQKVIGNEVDKIARVRYTVTGGWEEPEITRLENIDYPAESKEDTAADNKL